MPSIAINYRNPRNWAPRGQILDARVITNPIVRRSLIDLCNAMAAWLEGRESKPALSLISSALAHNSRVVSPIAATALGVLMDDDELAALHLLQVFKAAPAHPRMMIMRFVPSSRLSAAALEALIRAGLADRSIHVRHEAAGAASDFRLSSFLPDLRRALTTHSDQASQRIFSEAVSVLERGYHARYVPECDRWYVTVPGGLSAPFDPATVASKGLEQIARELISESQ